MFTKDLVIRLTRVCKSRGTSSQTPLSSQLNRVICRNNSTIHTTYGLTLSDRTQWSTIRAIYPVVFKNEFHLSSSCRMFIQVEETPNPNSLKFYPGQTVLESGTADFQDKVQGSLKSPLAKALFRIKGVKSVFFSQDFITVSKDDDEKIEWNILKPQIFSEIMIFYTMKQPILYDLLNKDSTQIEETDSDVVKEIKELIVDKIRPTIQEDGGDLEFVSYEDNVVRVRLQGACTSCPSSVVTLKSGIRNMLQYHIPEIRDVEQVTDEV